MQGQSGLSPVQAMGCRLLAMEKPSPFTQPTPASWPFVEVFFPSVLYVKDEVRLGHRPFGKCHGLLVCGVSMPYCALPPFWMWEADSSADLLPEGYYHLAEVGDLAYNTPEFLIASKVSVKWGGLLEAIGVHSHSRHGAMKMALYSHRVGPSTSTLCCQL